MRILAIGAGYVGLATAIGFARHGHEVRLIEVDKARLRLLRDGALPFEDRSLTAGLANCLGSGLTISDWDEAPGDRSEVAFICVNTPPAGSGALDVSRVHECAARAANLTAGAAVIAIRSTVNPGTAVAVERELRGAWPRHRRRLEPGVPPRGHGAVRLRPSGPPRGRRPQPPRAQADA